MSINITSIPGLINQLKTLFKNVSSVEEAVSDLYSVTSETKETYDKFFASANKSAQELGRSLSDLIQLTAEWARLGYSLDEAGLLAKTSAVYTAISGVNDKTAISDIQAAMKAFHIEAEESVSIIDRLNAVGQQYNVTAADLGAGLNIAASALSLAGNSMDESLALLTVMSELTQDSANAGDFLRTLSMNLLGYDEATGTYTKDLEKLNNLIKSITKNADIPSGISIFTDDTKNSCKSTYQFVKEIAEIWNELSSQKQTLLLEVITGNPYDQNLPSLLNNMPKADEVLQTSLSSDGSALQEQERRMDSFETKAQQLKAVFAEWKKQISETFQNADEKLNKLKSTAKTAFTVPQSDIKLISKDDFVNTFKKVKNSSLKLPSEDKFIKLITGVNADDFFNDFNLIEPKNTASFTQWCNQFETMDNTMRDYLTHCMKNDVPASFDNYSKYVEKAIMQNQQFSLSAKAGKIAMQGLAKVGDVLLEEGINLALSFVIEKLNEFANAAKISKEKADSFAKSVRSAMKDFSGNSSTLTSLSNEYRELSKGVNAFGENISLSTNQYERYKEIVAQISEIMPDLTTYFNSQGEAIGFTKGKLVDLNGEYKNYIQSQAKEFLINGNSEGSTFQDAIDNFANNSKFGFWTQLIKNLKNNWGIYDADDVPVDTMLSAFKELQEKSQAEMAAYFMYYDRSGDGTPIATEHNKIRGTALKILDINADDISEMSDECFHQLQLKIDTTIERLQNDYTTDMLAITSGLIQSAYSKDAFWNLDESLRNDVTTMLSSINADVWRSLGYNTSLEAESFVSQIINDIAANKDGFTDAWNELFALDESKLSANEYIAKVNDLIETICDVLGIEGEENRRQFMLSLGFDTDIEQGMLNGLKEKLINSDSKTNLTSGAVSAIGVTASEEDATALNWINSLNRSELEFANSDAFLDALEAQRRKLDDAALSAADYDAALEQVKNTQQTTDPPAPWDYSETITQLNTIREKFGVLDNTLAKLNQPGGQIGFEDFYSIHEAFSDLSGIDAYIQRLQEAGNNAEAAASVMQDLVNEYLDYSGILDNITDKNVDLVVATLEEIGITNAQTLVTEQLAATKEYLALAGKSVTDSEWDEIAAVALGDQVSQAARENLSKLALAKLNLNDLTIDSDDDIDNIIALANAAGASSEYIDAMRRSLEAIQNAENRNRKKQENQPETPALSLLKGSIGAKLSDFMNNYMIESEKKKIADIISEITSFQLDPNQFKADYKGKKTAEDSAEAAEAVETDWKEVLDHLLNLYKTELDSGLSDFTAFLNKSRAKIEEFYRDGKISAKDYWDYVGNLYEDQLSGYDRVISAVTDRIDEEIDALEKQKEATEQSYQVKIDAIQEEIDKLEEANRKREEQIDLEAAQWELERARNQRTKAVFNGSEKIYTADLKAVREAQENLEDKEFQRKISDLESQVESLEEEMKQATQTIDDQIAKLKEYKEQWQSVADAYEKSRDRMYADQILGQNWEAEILNGRIDTLNAFKEQYIAIQQAIADAAWQSANEQIKAEQAAQNSTAGNAAGSAAGNTTAGTTGAGSTGASSENQNPSGQTDPASGRTISSALRAELFSGASKTSADRYLPVQNQNELWEKCRHLLPDAPPVSYPASLLQLTGYPAGNTAQSSSVSVTIGDIHLHDVQNTDSLSRAILKELPGRLTQAVSRN